jgi:[CysO sulfur-carrier protein]-S-L-cysteine hydrolase
VLISRALLDELIAHARAEAPNECCGIVAVELDASDSARRARAARVHRAVNAAASPLRFEVDGRELLRTIDEIEGAGRELGAIYHSHTRSAPYPSQTDINFAVNWPGVEWIIVGLADGEEPEVRSYLIDGAQVREVALEESGT